MAADGETMRRSRWGAGPQIALVTAAWTGLALVVHWVFYPTFAVAGAWRSVFRVSGLGLLGVGVVIYVAVAVHFGRRRRREGLVTTGPYAYVRHPLYAVGFLFLAPGVILLVGSWLLLSVPPVMYLAARVFTPKEEAELDDRYGEPFRQYRRCTGRFVPSLRARTVRVDEKNRPLKEEAAGARNSASD